jgi:hypothetical protein
MIDDEPQSAPHGAPDVENGRTERAESCKNSGSKTLQAPRGPDPEQRPHQHGQIPPGERDEITRNYNVS